MDKNYIQFNRSSCQNCYKCIRVCPVKSIAFKDNMAQIIEEDCIQCGACYTVCPQGAKVIRNDWDKVQSRIDRGKKVIASVAPSFAANYGVGIESVKRTLEKLGFYDAGETAVGATAVKKEYEKILKSGQYPVLISSCCHTLNTLVAKYYPGALPYIAPVITPMEAHCRMIKEREPEAFTVFIGPCISKKAESECEGSSVDAALTFRELSRRMEKKGVKFDNIPDTAPGGRARLFPTGGGIIKSMDPVEGIEYIAVDGPQNCINALKDIARGSIKNCFVEMNFCTGSCIGGPAMDREEKLPVKDAIAVRAYSDKGDFTLTENPDMEKSYGFIPSRGTRPGAAQVDRVLARMGKSDPAKRLNCGSCGYNSCYEKAVAVCQGKAVETMCLPYLIERSQSFSDNVIEHTPNGIIVTDEDFIIRQVNPAACRIVNIPRAKTIIGLPLDRILRPDICVQAMSEGQVIRDKITYLPDYDRVVSQTAFYDADYKVCTLILRDVTEERTAKERKSRTNAKAVQITQGVIEKQMRVVQEIASLLGETVAETQVALSKMEETLQDE